MPAPEAGQPPSTSCLRTAGPHPPPCCLQFDIQLDEEGAEKISTVQEAADLIAAQIDS